MNYKLRIFIYERDNYQCWRCGRKVRNGKKANRKNLPLATLDHYIPRSKGGSSDPDNLKTCCKTCNERKGSKMPPDVPVFGQYCSDSNKVSCMKSYPSIPGPSKAPHLPCTAFVKYDGSNIRAEYSRKRGWYKFGTRKTMFDKTHEVWGKSIDLFNEKIAPGIEEVLKTEKMYRGVDSVLVFCEYFGPSSFAGQHAENEPMTLMLFDVNIHKRGFVGPRDFVKHFGHHPYAAEVVYEGNLSKDFIESVKNGAYPLQEGVVCKGGEAHKLWMVKIKTAEWIDRVKSLYPQEWQRFHDSEDEA